MSGIKPVKINEKANFFETTNLDKKHVNSPIKAADFNLTSIDLGEVWDDITNFPNYIRLTDAQKDFVEGSHPESIEIAPDGVAIITYANRTLWIRPDGTMQKKVVVESYLSSINAPDPSYNLTEIYDESGQKVLTRIETYNDAESVIAFDEFGHVVHGNVFYFDGVIYSWVPNGDRVTKTWTKDGVVIKHGFYEKDSNGQISYEVEYENDVKTHEYIRHQEQGYSETYDYGVGFEIDYFRYPSRSKYLDENRRPISEEEYNKRLNKKHERDKELYC